jgi:hypothetical protein
MSSGSGQSVIDRGAAAVFSVNRRDRGKPGSPSNDDWHRYRHPRAACLRRRSRSRSADGCLECARHVLTSCLKRISWSSVPAVGCEAVTSSRSGSTACRPAGSDHRGADGRTRRNDRPHRPVTSREVRHCCIVVRSSGRGYRTVRDASDCECVTDKSHREGAYWCSHA